MPSKNDRVKEGRSRISVIIDDTIVHVLDEMGKLERRSRAQIINLLLLDSLDRRGFSPEIIQNDQARRGEIEDWQARGIGSFISFHEENIRKDRHDILTWYYQHHITIFDEANNVIGHISRPDAKELGIVEGLWDEDKIMLPYDYDGPLLGYCNENPDPDHPSRKMHDEEDEY